MFEDLKNNLVHEKKIVSEMKVVAVGMDGDSFHKGFYESSLRALSEQLRVLNNAVPNMLKEWSGFGMSEKKDSKKKVLKPKKKIINNSKETVTVSYVEPSSKEKKMVTINKKDKEEFLKKLKLGDDAFNRLKRSEKKKLVPSERTANPYAVFSSRFFGKLAGEISPNFSEVNKDLKKANMPILLSSYLAMAMMSSVFAFAFGFLIFLFLLFFSLSNWYFVFLPFGFVGLTMAGFYFYPNSEASAAQKSISYELPFATIYMAAVAGSDITPVKIFRIITRSADYPTIGAELKKVLVQVEVYGYDIVTSLKNVAKTTSNKKLSELFSGLATNISSGGALKNYLDKKSESFLTDYKLDRQKYSALAGTFMDVYISILIAAPLILVMMGIIMNVSGFGLAGMGIKTMMTLTIGLVIIVNIIFIFVLNMKQPKV